MVVNDLRSLSLFIRYLQEKKSYKPVLISNESALIFQGPDDF